MNYILEEHKEEEELKKWGFTKVYRMLIRKKLSAIDFSSRTEGPLSTFQSITSIQKSPKQLWATTSKQFLIPKAGDLL